MYPQHGQHGGNILSTGKSSNSSSSSNAAAGFASFIVSALLSEVVAFAVGAAPEAGAADMTAEVIRSGEQDGGVKGPSGIVFGTRERRLRCW